MRKNKRSDYRGMFAQFGIVTGKNNGNWKGGIHYRKDGYILVRNGVFPKTYKGARYTLLHRLVMEKHLKRKLTKNEIVHHKNGDKSDNRISNLEVLTQSKHAKLHMKQDIATGRIISNNTHMAKSTMGKADPKKAESPKNLKAVFGTPKKMKK